MTDEEYAKQKEQGAKNWESLKNFFGGRRSADEPSAPIENRQPPKVEKETKAEPVKAEPVKAEPAKTSPVKTPSVAQQMKDREKGGPNERANYAQGFQSKPGNASYAYGPDYFEEEYLRKPNRDSFEFTGNPKKAEEYRQSLMPVNKPKPKPPAPAPASAAEKTPAAPAKPSYVGAGDSDDSVETKKKNELERLKRVGSGAVEQTMMGPVETVAFGASKLPAMARAGLGALRNSGTGKFPEEKPEISVPRTPAVERKAKVEGPPASAAAPKPKTSAEQMGLRETEPMRRAREAKEKFEAAGKSAKEAADKSSKNAADEVAAEAAKRAASKRQTPDNRRFPNKGSATLGRPKASGEFRATNNKFDRPVGEKRGPKTDEVLEREGLPIKKGGKIPAFKKGGLVGRADGCAIRGKTKGRMV
jgi:hypothetical protein